MLMSWAIRFGCKYKALKMLNYTLFDSHCWPSKRHLTLDLFFFFFIFALVLRTMQCYIYAFYMWCGETDQNRIFLYFGTYIVFLNWFTTRSFFPLSFTLWMCSTQHKLFYGEHILCLSFFSASCVQFIELMPDNKDWGICLKQKKIQLKMDKILFNVQCRVILRFLWWLYFVVFRNVNIGFVCELCMCMWVLSDEHNEKIKIVESAQFHVP